MTNDELNKYIQHYIEKDKTGRAIMLTGPWGIGKSYYIRNGLIPFLSKPENGKHSCIVVSLYGLSSLAEVSKAIYLEARMKKLSFKSEAGKAAVLTGKTVLKGVASFFGVDLSVDANSLQELYESIDLSGKLIILEDVERTEIDVLQILGYVNNLVEQDGVKVLLVTNEDEIAQFEPIKEENSEKEEAALFIDKVTEHKNRKFTQETIRYLEIKEKTVGDTIHFWGDIQSAVKQIISSFNNRIIQTFNNDECPRDILDIMAHMQSFNLRSFIFACQKAVDIYDLIEELGPYSADFLKSIFYGIVFFSLRLHAGTKVNWVGSQYYSLELGNDRFPLFRFCYDYILKQDFDIAVLSKTAETYENLRLYDPNKTSSDPDLQILNAYSIHTDKEVIDAVNRVTQRLNDPNDISFYDYGRIAMSLISAKYILGADIEKAKALLISNLKGRSDALDAERIFWYAVNVKPEEAKDEYAALIEGMHRSLMDKGSFIPDFSYMPEQASALYQYVTQKSGNLYSMHGFMKYMDVQKLIAMFSSSTSSQMNDIRMTFISLYRIGNIREFLSDDLPAIIELIEGLEKIENSAHFDKIQRIQCRWFIDNLHDIKNRL